MSDAPQSQVGKVLAELIIAKDTPDQGVTLTHCDVVELMGYINILLEITGLATSDAARLREKYEPKT